jgi:hypothetical protein
LPHAVLAAAETSGWGADIDSMVERADGGRQSAGAHSKHGHPSNAKGGSVTAIVERRARATPRATSVKPRNPHTEESLSMRRLVVRPPFPGQRKRRLSPHAAASYGQVSGM